MSRYVPETFPHQWLPEKLELKSWEQIEPWYQKLMDQPIEITGAALGWQTARQIAVHDPLNRERHRVDAADRRDSGHGGTRKTQQGGDQTTP